MTRSAPGPPQGYACSCMELIAHAGHPVYDHPAMGAIAVAAMVIPFVVLFFVARIFLRARDEDERPPERKI